jgi:hypothetical protein
VKLERGAQPGVFFGVQVDALNERGFGGVEQRGKAVLYVAEIATGFLT